MAAVVVEAAVLPRPLSIASPIMGSPAFAVSSTRVVKSLPQFKGLKIQSGSLSQSVVRTNSMNTRRTDLRGGTSIVCESQKTTAVEVSEVAEETWKSLVLENDLPVLVEFWAPWCGPCCMMHPLIDDLAKQYVGKLKCFKLNTDESPLVASQYGVRSIPTVIMFKNGEKKDAVVGAVTKTALTTNIEKFL